MNVSIAWRCALGVLLAHGAFAFLTWFTLPPRIPMHFGPTGKPAEAASASDGNHDGLRRFVGKLRDPRFYRTPIWDVSDRSWIHAGNALVYSDSGLWVSCSSTAGSDPMVEGGNARYSASGIVSRPPRFCGQLD